LDEGIVHAAHNLFVHTDAVPNRQEIEEFSRLVPTPDQLIWVTAPTAQSISVLLGRGHTRVRATLGAACAFAEHAQVTFEVLAATELQTRIYQVDNTAPAADRRDATVRARAQMIGTFLMHQLCDDAQAQVAAPFAGRRVEVI
jgi:hypothetical protein